MPNWKKVIVSGSDALLNSLNVTGDASFLNDSVVIEADSSTVLEVTGDISGSGNLFIEGLAYDSTPVTDGVVVYDTANGQFYYTGSYSQGGDSGGGDAYKYFQIHGNHTGAPSTTVTAGGSDRYFRFVSESNISLSADDGVDDAGSTSPDYIRINAIPSPSDTYVQYNSASVFHGDIGLRYDAEQESFRSGDSDPNQNPNNFGDYSGSHLLVDNRELVTNARYPVRNMHYHILGMNGRSFGIPKPGGDNYQPQGTYTSMGTGYQNYGPLPHSLNLDHVFNNASLENDILNGNVMVGGPYIHFHETKGFTVYANNFYSVPGSPATSIGSDGFVIYPSASSEYDDSGSLLTPLASASGRIYIDEIATPADSTFNISGRKNTQLQTGESGSEETYFMYENTTNTVGIGKGIDEGYIKGINTSKLAIVSGGLEVSGGMDITEVDISKQGGFFYHPVERGNEEQDESGKYGRIFNLGFLGNASLVPFNRRIEFNRSSYYELGSRRDGGGSAARAFVLEVDEVEIATTRTSSDPEEAPKAGIRFTSNPSIEFYNTDASSSISGAFEPASASAQIKFDTASSAVDFFAGDTTSDLTNVLHISRSDSQPNIGIGTSDPVTNLDIRSITSSDPANIILRTNEDGDIQVGEETGRIIFAIESASYLGTDFIASGSTTAIYSKVLGSNLNGAYGSLTFEVNDDSSVTEPIEAMTIGYALGPSSTDVGFVLSGSIQTTAGANVLSMRSDVSNQELVRLGFVTADIPELDRGSLLLKNDGTTQVSLNWSTSDFLNTGNNFGVGTTTPESKLHVVGDIRATGDIIAENYIVSSSVTYMTQSFSNGSTIFGDTLDDTHQFTGSLNITGSITANEYIGLPPGLVSGSSQIDHDATTNFVAAEHFTQANITTVGTVTTGDVSAILPSNVVSGSSQTVANLSNQDVDLGTGEITTNTIETISFNITNDSVTSVDTFNTSSYNGAIYDYILKDTGVGARAGQFMVAHDNGLVTYTDTSTKHLTDSTIPEISADIVNSDLRIRVTNGNGYTFKSFVKKL